jgi:hypothetical protein
MTRSLLMTPSRLMTPSPLKQAMKGAPPRRPPNQCQPSGLSGAPALPRLTDLGCAGRDQGAGLFAMWVPAMPHTPATC